ncbi:hypothetical protein Tco_1086568, partial [Tanacetum coccineum]
TGRVNVNSVRPNVNTGRTNVNPGSSNVNTVRSRQPVPTRTSNSFGPKRSQMNQFNQRRYGYIKNHKKTVKNGQARTREQKSVQKPEAMVKPQSSCSQKVKEKSTHGQQKSTTRRQNSK